jgi:uncharacterized protein YjiS (DUF1127 family)
MSEGNLMMNLKISHPGAAEIVAPAWPLGAINGNLRRVRAVLRRHRKISRTTRELGALSDRALADIGVLRCDIGRLARETVDRR